MSTPLLWNPGAARGKYARMLERLVRGRDLELVEATGAENARCLSATLAARYPRVIVAGLSSGEIQANFSAGGTN